MFNSIALYLRCKACKKDFSIKANAPSRMDLENDLGTEFNATCDSCAKRSKYHVNEVKAISSISLPIIIMGGVVLLAGILTLILFSEGFISLAVIGLPIFIWGIYQNAVEKRMTTFNRNIVNRTTPYTPKNPKRL